MYVNVLTFSFETRPQPFTMVSNSSEIHLIHFKHFPKTKHSPSSRPPLPWQPKSSHGSWRSKEVSKRSTRTDKKPEQKGSSLICLETRCRIMSCEWDSISCEDNELLFVIGYCLNGLSCWSTLWVSLWVNDRSVESGGMRLTVCCVSTFSWHKRHW